VTAAMVIVNILSDIDRMERMIGTHWVRCVAPR
jgi:hypothetical protein